MPKISIIVPVYKVERYLNRCVDSILCQSFQDFELILVDDGSPDCCGMICDAFAQKDDRIHVIHQQNGGLSAARNAGIDWTFTNSNSDWITFIDSDDWIYPQYLEFLYRAAIEECVDISVCGTVYEKNSYHNMQPQNYAVCKVSSENYWVERNGDVSVAWEKLYNRELFSEIRFPVGTIYEDEFTTYKLLFAVSDIAVVSNCLYIYFFSESSILRSDWNEKKFANVDAVLEQLLYFKQHGFIQAEKNVRRKLVYVLKQDYKIIKEKPEKYGKYKMIIDEKLRKFFRQYLGIRVMGVRGMGNFMGKYMILICNLKIYVRQVNRIVKEKGLKGIFAKLREHI